MIAIFQIKWNSVSYKTIYIIKALKSLSLFSGYHVNLVAGENAALCKRRSVQECLVAEAAHGRVNHPTSQFRNL